MVDNFNQLGYKVYVTKDRGKQERGQARILPPNRIGSFKHVVGKILAGPRFCPHAD